MAGFELHGMLIHNNDDNSGHVIPSHATTPRLPASFNITLLSPARLDYLFLFKREGRCWRFNKEICFHLRRAFSAQREKA